MAITILVCRCGMRLNARGAMPGRTGKCPKCGAPLRIPGNESDQASPADRARPRSAERRPRTIAAEAPVYEVEEIPPPPTPNLTRPPVFTPTRIKRPSKPATLIERIEAWEGLVRPPAAPEGLWGSLLYPLWGSTGLAFLVFFPVIWWFISLPTFGFLHMTLGGEASGGAPIRALIPSLMGLLIVFGYTLLFLAQVLFSSAMGEVRHPRWPEAEMYEIFRGLLRWVWAFLSGFLMGGLPAILFARLCETLEPLDWLVVVGLLAWGAAYGQMALLVTLLFDDPLAANPVTVCQAFWRMGWIYFRPCLVGAVAMVLAVGMLLVVLTVRMPVLALAGLWAFWVFVLYEAMVVMRVLGLEYRRNAAKLGWFREST